MFYAIAAYFYASARMGIIIGDNNLYNNYIKLTIHIKYDCAIEFYLLYLTHTFGGNQ